MADGSEAADGMVQELRALMPAAAVAAAAQRKAAADLASPVVDPFDFPVDDQDAQASALLAKSRCGRLVIAVSCTNSTLQLL